jgi:hypothetical protein
MSETEHLSIVHDATWRAVVDHVDAAVAAGKISAAQRDMLLRPVKLLQYMADETPAALGDDFLAAERLRALLYLSAPWAALVDETQRILNEFDEKKMPPFGYAPGVLHHGALVLLGLAAVRVATAEPLVKLFSQTVQGVALLAAAAETLGRLEPSGPTGDTLAAMVEELVERDSAQAGDASVLQPMQADPVERGRWVSLQELMKRVVALTGESKLGMWDGGFSTVSEVTPNMALAGETIELGLSGPPLADPAVGLPDTLHVVFASPGARPIEARERPRFVGSRLVVQVPDGVRPGWVGFSDDVRVARSHEFRIRLREELKSFGVVGGLDVAPIPVDLIDPYAPPAGSPTLAFLAAPPRTAANRFYGGGPVIASADLSPPSVPAGESLTLRWESQAATEVEKQPGGERLPASGAISFTAPAQDGPVRITLTPIRRRDGSEDVRGNPVEVLARVGTPTTIVDVVVRQGGHKAPYFFGSPLDVEVVLSPDTAIADGTLLLDGQSIKSSASAPGRVTFAIPADRLRETTRITVVLGQGDPSLRREMSVRIDRARPVKVVLFEPSVVTRAVVAGASPLADPIERPVSTEELAAQLAQARALGLDVKKFDLPFVEDSLAVLPRPIASGDDPEILALLEALSVAAMRTTGFEDALWAVVLREPFGVPPQLAQVPAPLEGAAAVPAVAAPSRAWIALPAEGAQAVAVTALSGLADLIAATFQPQPASEARDRILTDRLRLLGHLLPGERVVLDSPRQEQRGAGAGPPAATGLTAVAFDGAGRELSRTPVRAVSGARPTTLALLLPVTAEMTRVALQHDDGTEVHSFVRGTSGPDLLSAELRGGELSWSYFHPDGAVPRLTVELIRHETDLKVEVSAPFMELDACGKVVFDDSNPPRPVLRGSATLQLHRVGSAEKLRLVATDGWNVKSADVNGPPIVNQQPVLVRRLGAGSFWADTSGLPISAWNLNGSQEALARLLHPELPRGDCSTETVTYEPVHAVVLQLPPDARGQIGVIAGAEKDDRPLGEDNA